MKKHLLNRALALVLAAVMVLGNLPAAAAAPTDLRWSGSDADVTWDHSDRLVQDVSETDTYKPADTVRVSIVLEGAPTAGAGFSTMDIGSNHQALVYDLDLNRVQKKLERTISVQALEGQPLDVVWNLTLVANIISANVPYGSLDAIRAVPGVADVIIERQYSPDTAETNVFSSAGMTGTTALWQTGYTGAGSRVAIIDTGTDTDHQSFDNGAYLYALEQNAAEKDMSYEDYVKSLDLLDAEEIAQVLENLNVNERIGVTAEQYYLNEKLPFAANYVDMDLTVDHDSDDQGSHGSHVAGIAAANRYIGQDGDYVDARQAVLMSGAAPDAQILTMKVFGNAAGPFESDYFAAIEDAIWLGCDSVNLSLGSGNPGTSTSSQFADVLDFLATTDTVVVMSAGNSGYWAESSATGYLYDDGVSFHTGGSPGSYTNSLSVASVDNDGTVGNYFAVGDRMVFYTETFGPYNKSLTSLDTAKTGTEYDYIFIDGVGQEADYTGMDLSGKVVFCSRGTTAFSEKGAAAAKLGAAAVVIYNNTTGSISMDLSAYRYTVPCVSILKSDAEAIRNASAEQTTSGGLTYYTGKLTVSSALGAAEFGSDYYTMSTFSSWGVPGSLELKPEITAPGGLIWSVNGVDPSGTGYELMSGTSMAAPQVTGMAALIAQYIRENELDVQTGLSVRHLTQSLLMSTAVPLREEASGGNYYSVLSQGAGLARVDLAASAESYVLVEDMPDGKVKAEFGEDPDREGIYCFSFSIHNLSGEVMTYALSADLFTQDIFESGGTMYLDTWTRELDSEARFSMDGVSLEGMIDSFERDLNGDGITNALDADYLLEYLMGNASELYADGDINGDGQVDSYDAHVLLSKQSGTYSVRVPAGGSVTVDAQLKLTDECKAFLEENYPVGAYVEGFVFAEPVADDEGAVGVSHSIPLLGYYGSWTEPGMYDVGSYLEYLYGEETRTSYLYNENGIRSNFVTINYGDGSEYLFGGNPIVEEREYMPERNAFNNQNGATLQNLRFSLIRNAANALIELRDAATGEVWLSEELDAMDSAYYYVNGGAWQNTQKKLGLGLDMSGIPEGTQLELSLITMPELYDSFEDLGAGAYLTTTFTIDNTEPEVLDIKLDGTDLKITAWDNQYIAAAVLMNEAGTSVLASAPANQTEPDTETTVTLDLSQVYGSDFVLAVYDYAENTAVCEVELELETQRPRFTAIDRTNAGYVGLDANGTNVTLASCAGRGKARAAEYVDGYVFEISDDNMLYVGANEDLYSFLLLSELDPSGEWKVAGFNDLAYSTADQTLYGTFYSDLNDMEVPYLCTIDLYTGEMAVLGELPIDANTLTIDGKGNFYSAIYGQSKLYTYRADVVTTGAYSLLGSLSGYSTTKLSSMAWDHETGELFWACAADSATHLLEVDPATAAVTYVNSFSFDAAGLFIASGSVGDTFAPTDNVISVSLPETTGTLVGQSVSLYAEVLPWNVSDASAVWTTSDSNVATVDASGTVTGVGEGTAVITAASVLDKSKRASCTVTVSALDRTLKGLVWDEKGDVFFGSFNTDTLPAFAELAYTDLPVATTAVAGETLYAGTLDVSTGYSDLYTVDPDTFAMTKVGGSVELCYTDMAWAPHLGHLMVTYFNYIALVDPSTGEYIGAFDWSANLAGDLVGITYFGSEYNSTYGEWVDSFLILDALGNVYLEGFMPYGGSYANFYGPQEGPLLNLGDPVDYSYFQGFHFDGEYVYWNRFHEADNCVELIVWDALDNGNVYHMGTFPEGVWPVSGLYTDAEITANSMTERFAAAQVGTAKLQSVSEAVPMGGLNAASVVPMSRGEVVKDEVIVEVTLPDEGTNGVMEITYDPELLELSEVAGNTEAFAWAEENGMVRLAFADRGAMAEETQIARVRFKVAGEGETSVTIRTTELGEEDADLTETIQLTLVHICPSENFVDVNEGNWWHGPVDYVVSKGYMNGMDATHFGPAVTMNRAQFVTVLYRMEGSPAVTFDGRFTDVPQNAFYTSAVAWAVEAGITNGSSATTFNPSGKLSRSELVTFMHRYAGYKGYDTSATADMTVFADADQMPRFSREAWCWSVTHGLVTGLSADTLAPLNQTNRAQAATIFQRFDSKMGK